MAKKNNPKAPHMAPETPTHSSEINYFNYIVLVFIYVFVLLVLFRSRIGKVSLEKIKQNYTEYRNFKDTTNVQTLQAYKNGSDFVVCNYVATNTNPDKDILLLPPTQYLSSFKKDFNHPLVAPIKFYYFGAKLKIVRYGDAEFDKGTLALGLDTQGEVIPVKLDTEEKKNFVFEKFKLNQPFK